MRIIVIILLSAIFLTCFIQPARADNRFYAHIGYSSVAWNSDLDLFYTLPSSRLGLVLDLGKIDIFLDRIDTQKRSRTSDMYGDVNFNMSRTDLGLKYKLPYLPFKARLAYRNYYMNTTSLQYKKSGHYNGLGIGAETKLPSVPVNLFASYYPSLTGPETLSDFEVGMGYRFSLRGFFSGRINLSHDSLGNSAGKNMSATIFSISLERSF
ncbi:MAG: hypothetical protein J7M18_07700 [Candidatus Eremiobacteraeota bacterium]|nr:hypothetical protein [Candidatus Eremiobacteraeota bacterium]